MRLLAILLCVLFCPLVYRAQQLHFFKPDNLEQLPSSESYNIMQDSRGYIWFSTEAGLCRYNGNSLKIFSEKEGLTEKATYNVWEDKKGKIWMTTSRNRVLFYDYAKDSLTETAFTKFCIEMCKKQLQQIYFARLSDDSNVWLSTQFSTAKINLQTQQATQVKITDSSNYYFLIEPEAIVPVKLIHDPKKEQLIRKRKKLYVTIKKGENKIIIPVAYTKSYSPESRALTTTNKKGEYAISFDNILIRIYPDMSWETTELNYPILNLYTDKDDGLWIATHKGGLIYFPDPKNRNYNIVSLPDLSVTGICEDAERGIWCTTLEKGVFYCRNKFVLNYTNIPGFNKRADFLKAIGNRLFTSSEKSELFEFYKNSIAKHLIKKLPNPALTDIIYYDHNWVISGKGSILKTNYDFRDHKGFLDEIRRSSIGANQLAVYGNRNIFAISHSSLLVIKECTVIEKDILLKSPGKCLLASDDFGLLAGCNDGLYNIDTSNYLQQKIPGITGSVTKLIETKNKDIWITTKENGVYVLKDHKIQKISDLLDLPTDRFFDITEDEENNLWLASNAGLVSIKKPYTKQNVSIYNSLNGLNSDEVLRVAACQGRLFVSTNEGLCSFPLQYDLSNNLPPSIYINTIKVNDKKVEPGGKMIFNYNENNIQVTYDILTFKHAALPVKLFYKVQGIDDAGHYLEGHELLLNNLPSGNYTITAFGVNNDNKLSILPVSISFEIKKPFWQTPLFIAGMVLLFISLTLFSVNRVIIRVQKKAEEKTRINKLLAEYQMSALRAQMNPHFIFNCINSIQRYILTNKSDEAYNYLAKFSKLIRLVLNYAEENLISLAEELEIVELYIELEQLRFENVFKCVIEIDPGIETNELMVPVLIMQPYIENAIWHGLMNLEKEKTGQVFIKLHMKGDILQVIIEDNGIGLERASLLRKKEHRSKGTGINSKRAEILSILSSGSEGNVLIEDIRGKNNITEGTRVIINIPQNKNNNE
ncbi:MAG TPA: histidine kinase [Bacteroidia bacterium]|nr:histidine kinase [Bacteroidia bacterium]